ISGGGSTAPAGNNKEIQFNDNGTFGSSADFTYDPVSNTLLIGATSPSTDRSHLDFVTETAVTDPNTGPSQWVFTNYNDGDGIQRGSGLFIRSARGTETNPQALKNGDRIGKLTFVGHDNVQFQVGGGSTRIDAIASQDWTSSAHGSNLVLSSINNNET